MWDVALKIALAVVFVLLYTRTVFRLGVASAMRRIMEQSSEDIQELIKILFEREGKKEDDSGEEEG